MATPDLDAWREFVSRNAGGGEIEGVVAAVVPFGVFVAFPNGVQGLLHASEYTEPPETGARIRVRIRAADFELRRMSLTAA